MIFAVSALCRDDFAPNVAATAAVLVSARLTRINRNWTKNSTPWANATSKTNSVSRARSPVTNTTPGSVVIVNVTDLLIAWEIPDNAFQDKLPIIPTESHVENGNILYRLKVNATLHRWSTGELVAGHTISIKSSRPHDSVKLSSATTDANGSVTVTLETRDKGSLTLSVQDSPDITDTTFPIALNEAWYESPFMITGYHVCNESDFSAQLVTANGVNDKHRSDFLYSATGLVMQGTGMALNGQYMRVSEMNTHWALNARYHADHLADPNGVTFTYTNGVHGAFGTVTANHSIAVDPAVIPPRMRVQIDAVGERHADDRGSQIKGYHIDNFNGAGTAVQAAWDNGTVNKTQRRVKYLGA